MHSSYDDDFVVIVMMLLSLAHSPRCTCSLYYILVVALLIAISFPHKVIAHKKRSNDKAYGSSIIHKHMIKTIYTYVYYIFSKGLRLNR